MDSPTFDDDTHERHELTYRVSLFGAANVGKTKLVNRLMHNKYTETYVPTIEEYYETIEEYAGVRFTLEVVDTCGTEQFPAMRKLNMQKSNLVLLVYDVMNLSSLKEVKRLYDICRDITHCMVIIVGAKADFLPGVVPENYKNCINDVNSYVYSMKDNLLSHCLCSARTCQGVENILEEGLTNVFNKITAKIGNLFFSN